MCRCRVNSGGGGLQPAETTRLTSAEIANGYRLACQIQVENDLDITIPEGLFEFADYDAEITGIRDLTHDTKWIGMHLIHPEAMRFKSGQYIQIQSKPYPGMDQTVSRSYSIASPSYQDRDVELIVRRVPDGICTTWIFDHLHEKERVSLVGPMGDFTLRGEDEEIIMVAGASGMAPMVSILKDMAKNRNDRKITYLFGAVCKRDLYYQDEMNALQSELSHFTFIPALSQPESCDNWNGETGLITLPFEQYLEKTDPSKIQVYLCGSPGMVQACLRILRKFNVGNDRTFFDPFI